MRRKKIILKRNPMRRKFKANIVTYKKSTFSRSALAQQAERPDDPSCPELIKLNRKAGNCRIRAMYFDRVVELGCAREEEE